MTDKHRQDPQGTNASCTNAWSCENPNFLRREGDRTCMHSHPWERELRVDKSTDRDKDGSSQRREDSKSAASLKSPSPTGDDS